MNSTSSREHPEQVLEVEILSKSSVDDLDGYGHECPAFGANLGSRTTVSYFIIVCHINIKHQFSFLWREIGQLLVIRGPGVVDCANVNLVWTLLDHLRLQLLLVGEAEVPEVDVVLQGEGELPVGHVVLVNLAVLHPPGVLLEGEQSLVVLRQQVSQHLGTIHIVFYTHDYNLHLGSAISQSLVEVNQAILAWSF